jgi:hypothetical protein
MQISTAPTKLPNVADRKGAGFKGEGVKKSFNTNIASSSKIPLRIGKDLHLSLYIEQGTPTRHISDALIMAIFCCLTFQRLFLFLCLNNKKS